MKNIYLMSLKVILAWKTSNVCLKTFCQVGSTSQLFTTLSILSPIVIYYMYVKSEKRILSFYNFCLVFLPKNTIDFKIRGTNITWRQFFFFVSFWEKKCFESCSTIFHKSQSTELKIGIFSTNSRRQFLADNKKIII
jgi:hypothetical protein